MRPKPQDRTRLRRALPHLVGAYAIAGLLTGAFYYGRIAFAPHDMRLTVATYVGVVWPAYWPIHLVKSATQPPLGKS
ncbi:MAG TPA: hypothetical protein VF601_16000 [Beijerinckiaceae bacterium]|jgi:hypothetical protein